MSGRKNLVSVASEAGSIVTLLTAVRAAGLVDLSLPKVCHEGASMGEDVKTYLPHPPDVCRFASGVRPCCSLGPAQACLT